MSWSKGPFLKPDGSLLFGSSEEVIAIGGTAIILHHGSDSLKIPKVRPLNSQSEDQNRHIGIYNGGARREFANEQAFYRRLGAHNGIAHCLQMSDDGTLLAFYRRGNLEVFFMNEREVDSARKAEWILSLIKTYL